MDKRANHVGKYHFSLGKRWSLSRGPGPLTAVGIAGDSQVTLGWGVRGWVAGGSFSHRDMG